MWTEEFFTTLYVSEDVCKNFEIVDDVLDIFGCMLKCGKEFTAVQR